MISHTCGLIESPLGQMVATVTADNRLEKLEFRDRYKGPALDEAEVLKSTKKHRILQQTQKELDEYFAGKRQEFTVPLVDEDHHLLAVPYGKTWTYQELAEFMGMPKAFRHAGRVCKTNNVCIIIPCHRVVAKSGIVNYGAGPERKTFLLELESKVIQGKLK
ncbi:methylated-DNA--protein-cysteine methyltransferase, constitutive [Phlebotomus papatasi]|uniref:methylated-DNA--protein-cysteine methyltransferase, constitutive n=1 Tax=Phlebotomus papatasi TaxID=29031 RepID=UPI0024844998|nr:methylated-DNA--protein-cysteine methyltransferase, constitutive [Phlebotomus papatasi]